MANKPLIPHLVKAWVTDYRNMWAEGEIFIKYYTKITSRFSRVSFDTEELNGNIERHLLRCPSFPMRRNSVLSGFGFSLLVDIHDWTEAKHDCKPFSAAAESPDAKETYRLLSSAIEVVRDSVFKDHAAQWSGIEGEKQRTQNRPLRDYTFEISFGGQTVT